MSSIPTGFYIMYFLYIQQGVYQPSSQIIMYTAGGYTNIQCSYRSDWGVQGHNIDKFGNYYI